MKASKVNINKEDYPLDVVFIADEEGGYLAEGLDKETKYRPIVIRETFINSPYRPILSRKNFIHPPMRLKIVPPLTYCLRVKEISETSFYAEAKIDNGTLSFFGTKKEIESIFIEIVSADKQMHLTFRGDLSLEEDYFGVSIAIEYRQFEKILRMWERDSIDEIICGLKTELINGLYVLDSSSPGYHYKVLPDKRIVKNYQDMPDHFTEFKNFEAYYISRDCFYLEITKEKPLPESRDPYDEGSTNNKSGEVEKRIEIINKLEEVKKYTKYIAIMMFIIILIRIF